MIIMGFVGPGAWASLFKWAKYPFPNKDVPALTFASNSTYTDFKCYYLVEETLELMKQRSMYRTIFLAAATGLFFFYFRAFAGTITTSITCRNTVKSNGAPELHMAIRNSGDVTAYHVVVTLILADMIKKYENLGNNPPGGKIEVGEKLMEPGLKPGNYVAVIQVDFQEESGIPHRVYHMAPMAYLMDQAGVFRPIPYPGTYLTGT